MIHLYIILAGLALLLAILAAFSLGYSQGAHLEPLPPEPLPTPPAWDKVDEPLDTMAMEIIANLHSNDIPLSLMTLMPPTRVEELANEVERLSSILEIKETLRARYHRLLKVEREKVRALTQRAKSK